MLNTATLLTYSHHAIRMMRIISYFSLITAFIFLHPAAAAGDNVSFYEHYGMDYGGDHAKFLDQGKTQIMLWLDKKSGAGFGSKVRYSSGYFNMSIKLPPGDSAGVIVAFYLRSEDGHGEVDFEFMGNLPGRDIKLQTNVFVDNVGNREQRIILPNARTENYVYTIVWNPNMITMLWGGQPIRVFRNVSGIGVGYPWKPMRVLASVWDGSDWATDGGRIKINWTHAPFIAEYAEFRVNGCSESSRDCGSSEYWWNRSPYTELTPGLRHRLNRIRPLLNYDYCTDTKRHPVTPPECASNDPVIL